MPRRIEEYISFREGKRIIMKFGGSVIAGLNEGVVLVPSTNMRSVL